jgi:hypothetical protein
VLPAGLAVIGDADVFTTAGDARVEVTAIDDGVRLVVKGAGETVTITGWAERPPTAGDLPVDHDGTTGVWTVDVSVPERGWTAVELLLIP